MSARVKQTLPLVSIVIPVYNGSNFLSEAIDSALAQTYSNIEIVIVNDGSGDDGETERICLSYGDRVKYFLKENGGVASALNFGIEKMSGDYFSWLSHDDLYEPTKIEDEVGEVLLQSDPVRTIIACNSTAIFQNGMKRGESIEKDVFDNYFDIFLGASARTGLNGCSLLIPRGVLIASGAFNETLPVTQDYDLWYRLSRDVKFTLIPKNLVMYRHHEMQDSIQKFEMSLAAGDDLRSEILQRVSRGTFVKFMESCKKNEKWLWGNYDTYKSRGNIKIPLSILFLLARYYDHDTSGSSRVNSEILAYEVRYGSSLGDAGAEERTNFADKARALMQLVSTRDYVNSRNTESLNIFSRYLEIVRSEGFMFMLEKAIRKLLRIVFRK